MYGRFSGYVSCIGYLDGRYPFSTLSFELRLAEREIRIRQSVSERVDDGFIGRIEVAVAYPDIFFVIRIIELLAAFRHSHHLEV